MINLKPLITIQKHFIRIVKKKTKHESSLPLFKALNILPLRNLYIYKVLKLFFIRSRNSYTKSVYKLRLRNADDAVVPRPTRTYFTKTYQFLAPLIFNRIPQQIKNINTSKLFARHLRSWLLTIEDVDELLIHVQI